MIMARYCGIKRLIDASKENTSVYGIPIAMAATENSDARITSEAKRIFDANSIETKTFDNEKVQRYLNVDSRDSRLWPLIKEVRIAGPI